MPFLHIHLIVYFLAGLFVSSFAFAKDLELTREVVIKREGSFWGSPNVIAKADDEGYVITGESWAIKTDSDGKVLWKYIRDKFKAEFKGAVALQDGTTFLCGDMRTDPYDKTDKYEYRPIILTHLDVSGHLINERLIVPKIRSERGTLFSTGCVRWGNDVAIVGHLMHAGAHVEGLMNPNTDQCYWLLVVDASGNTKWEKQIESWDGIGGALPPMVLSDSSLVFAGQPFNKTELYRFNINGDLIVKKSLTGNYIFVHTDIANGALQLYGFDRDKKLEPH